MKKQIIGLLVFLFTIINVNYSANILCHKVELTENRTTFNKTVVEFYMEETIWNNFPTAYKGVFQTYTTVKENYDDLTLLDQGSGEYTIIFPYPVNLDTITTLGYTNFVVTRELQISSFLDYNNLHIPPIPLESLTKEGVISFVFHYDQIILSTQKIKIYLTDKYNLPEYNSTDTVNAYNNGYSNGYSNGVASVNCPFTAQDTVDAYNNGVASVSCPFTAQDTVDAYNNGYSNGVASVNCPFTAQDTVDAYNNGYSNGVVSIDTLIIWNNGYSKGLNDCSGSAIQSVQSTVGNLNVYPNPTEKTDILNVDCDDFYKFDILTINGSVIYTSYDKTISVSDFTDTPGMYIISVVDYDNNVGTTKIIVQ